MSKTIRVNDIYQKDYVYSRTEPVGKNFSVDFTPELTPKQMLTLGVFGGRYMSDKPKEFPNEWFTKAKLSHKKDTTLNFYGVDASMPLTHWLKKGWIHKDDPRGWFQWYCRYYMGRRHEDDNRQIKRWKQMKRHAAQIQKNCMRADLDCRKRQRQALLHWAYDSRKL